MKIPKKPELKAVKNKFEISLNNNLFLFYDISFICYFKYFS